MLGINCQSFEIAEAAFNYSTRSRTPIVLELDQYLITPSGTGVSLCSTAQFMEFIRNLKIGFSGSKISVLRSNLGPRSSSKKELSTVFNIIENDCRVGIDYFHLDFSELKGANTEVINKQKEAVRYILNLNSNAQFQFGSINPNRNYSYQSLRTIVDSYADVQQPAYWIIPTGSEVKEDFQYGVFNYELVRQFKLLMGSYNIKLKELNGDYSDSVKMDYRKGLISYFTLSYHLGQAQTDFVLQNARDLNINSSNWIEDCYKTKLWKPFLYSTDANDVELCASYAGMYCFGFPSYKRLFNTLQDAIPGFRERLINQLEQIIGTYEKAL